MNTYEIRQSENGLRKAYGKLMDRISKHVTLLARSDKPISSVMGVKRILYKYKRALTTPLPTKPTSAFNHDLILLANDVLDKFDVDVFETIEIGLVGEKDLKRILIVYYYEQMSKKGMKYKDIKRILCDKYGFSISSIEKLMYGK
jgi:hypothetical protein